MKITPENLPKHELIGLNAEVIKSTDQSLEGLKGEVMDETKSMLRIDDKWVEKKNCTFIFEISSGQKVSVKGQLINKRPEERATMKLPRKWF